MSGDTNGSHQETNIEGGLTITGSQGVAVGTGSTAYGGMSAAPQIQELRQLVTDLTQRLAEHQHELDNPDQVQASTEMLREQLDAPQPDRHRLGALLSSIASGVSNVAVLAEAVRKIQNVLTLMF